MTLIPVPSMLSVRIEAVSDYMRQEGDEHAATVSGLAKEPNSMHGALIFSASCLETIDSSRRPMPLRASIGAVGLAFAGQRSIPTR